MSAVMEAIDHMTTFEKLETIDYLASSISASGKNISTAWHGRELRETEACVASGSGIRGILHFPHIPHF